MKSTQPDGNRCSNNVREDWVRILERVARPVLMAQAEGRLRRSIPMRFGADAQEFRRRFVAIEAVGRTLAGIAPWLEQ